MASFDQTAERSASMAESATEPNPQAHWASIRRREMGGALVNVGRFMPA
jgi:hypothetical protein